MNNMRDFPEKHAEPLNSDASGAWEFLNHSNANLNPELQDPVENPTASSLQESLSNASYNFPNFRFESSAWRTFEGGREALPRTHQTHFQSLGEQRATVNRSRSYRGNRHLPRRNGRGRGWQVNGRNNRNTSRQTSRKISTGSLPSNKEEDEKSSSSGQYSDSESVHSNKSCPTVSSTQIKLEEKFQSLNINQFSGPLMSETIESSDPFSLDSCTQNNINNVIIESTTETEINPPQVTSISTNDNMFAFRKAKEAYDNVLKGLSPTDIIMDSRRQVEKLTDDVVTQNLKKIERFKSSLTPESTNDVAKRHLNNLMQQQREFEQFITKVKTSFSSIMVSDIQELVISSDMIKDMVENESKLFKRSLPAYAHKSEILSKVKKNQVTIISADAPYFLNMMLPIFFKSEYKNCVLISSETSKVLKECLRNNLFYLVSNRIGMNNLEEEKFNSEFKFMTVEELGQTFLEDYTFSEKSSFIILNLPLKRSLTLDIMLADIRDMLRNQSNAKLILLASKFDETNKYEIYFSETSVAVLTLPSLTIPVSTVWKNSSLLPTDDYIDEVIKTVLSIHSLDKKGDIMAFLPSCSDIKKAAAKLRIKMNDFQFTELECELLHDESSNKNCLNMFNKRSSLKQTVYFVTDCGEKITLPSVIHIIDCGLKKELMFDNTKKLDVLTTTFISCSKARLRKSLAGITQSGMCYRLYNKEDYRKEMPRRELSELLTVNPFNSLIKIFHHHKNSAVEDDFVENVPESIKRNALNLLCKAGALKENKLTGIGKSMVKLPFPARISKFILMGIEWGIGYDIIMLVAFFEEKGCLFQHFDDPVKQRIVDVMKVQLSKNDSDAWTFVSIYKSWIENECSKFWTDRFCLNLDTLKSIENKAKEICLILGNCLNENIKMTFSDFFDYETFLDIVFECFKDNLCVYTGHYKSGYRVLSSHCFAFLHPSSVISSSEENSPQFLIFDHISCTSKDFLINITAIPPDHIMKALEEQTIDFDYSDMFEKSLVQQVIEPVSERVLKQVFLGIKGGHLKKIEDYVKKELGTDSIVIEPILEKKRVLVFALESLIDKAVEMVRCIIDLVMGNANRSEEIKTLILKRGQIQLPMEIRWLKGAEVASVKVSDPGSLVNQGTFNPVENDEEPPCQIQKCVSVKWVRRECSGHGFVTFEGKDFLLACRKLGMRTFKFNEKEIFIQRSKKAENQLYLQYLPRDTNAKDLEIALMRLLPGVKMNLELEFFPPFETSEEELLGIRTEVEENCRKFAKLVDFYVVVPNPEPTDTTMTAYVILSNNDDVSLVVENLSASKMNGMELACLPVYRSVIKCNINIGKFLESRFKSMLTELRDDLEEKYGCLDHFTFDIIRIDEDFVAIKMLSQQLETLEKLLRTVNALLEGELLNNSFSRKLSKIFCHGGHMWLKQTLEKTCNVYVIEDNLTKTLRLYGSKENCALSRDKIKQFLEDTENEGVKYISFTAEGGNKKLMKALIMQYGANLEKLIESAGLQFAVLDVRRSLLSLHGSRDSIEEAENYLKRLNLEGMDPRDFSMILGDVGNCPICSCAAYNLSFRLESCGHLYCLECLLGLVELAEFPIECAECSECLTLDDIYKVLEEDNIKVEELLGKGVKKFIDVNRDKLYCCPAPDCTMFFYKNELNSDKIHCPLCQNDICSKCNVIFHQGYSCEMYQGSKLDPDYSFKVWNAGKDVKQCPKCSNAIERFAGCDHMHCQKCSAHFCWVCLTEFPTSRDVYNHLPFCPQHRKW